MVEYQSIEIAPLEIKKYDDVIGKLRFPDSCKPDGYLEEYILKPQKN